MPPKPKGDAAPAAGSLDDLKLENGPAAPDADEADAAQVADQPDPELDGDDKAAPATDGDEPCPEHFPGGWAGEIVKRTDLMTNGRSRSVTCEHGTYARPSDK